MKSPRCSSCNSSNELEPGRHRHLTFLWKGRHVSIMCRIQKSQRSYRQRLLSLSQHGPVHQYIGISNDSLDTAPEQQLLPNKKLPNEMERNPSFRHIMNYSRIFVCGWDWNTYWEHFSEMNVIYYSKLQIFSLHGWYCEFLKAQRPIPKRWDTSRRYSAMLPSL